MFINPSIEVKLRQSGRGRAFVTLIQQLYIKTIRINVIIYRFSLVDKASRKRRKLKYSGNESQGWTSTEAGVTEM